MTFTTFTLGSDGVIRDLGKHEYMPGHVFPVNAWVQQIDPETRKPINLDAAAVIAASLYPHVISEPVQREAIR